MGKENYENPFDTPSPDMILEMFEQLDPSETFFSKEQRMKALEKATESARAKAPNAMGDEAMDVLYNCYKEELKKISS